MEIFKIPASMKKEMEETLAVDPLYRLSITIKDSSVFGENGFIYLILEGVEDRIKLAREKLSPISAKIEEKEAEKVTKFIEEERNNVYNSLGSIFG